MAPLELTLHAPKAQFVVGEGVVLQIEQVAHAALELESIDLNRDRTTVHVWASRGGILSKASFRGEDHCALHRISTFQELGERFSVQPGQAWTSELELLRFDRPLVEGHYRVEIEYRYGTSAGDVVRSNAVEFDVIRGEVGRCAWRWYGADSPKDELAVFWKNDGAIGKGWHFHRSVAHDPTILRTSALIGAQPAGDLRPTLAHLNDITHFHYTRWAIWIDGDSLVGMQFHPGGPMGAPVIAHHGLRDATIVDPPLHRRDDVVTSLILGIDANTGVVATLLNLGSPSANAVARWSFPASSIPAEAVILWANAEDPTQGTLVWVDGDRLRKLDTGSGGEAVLLQCDVPLSLLRLDQWLGVTGQLIVVADRGDALEVYLWAVGSLEAPPTRWSVARTRSSEQPAWRGPYDVVPAGERGFMMLFDDDTDWIVVGPSSVARLAKTQVEQSGVPKLVVSRRGEAFLVEFRPTAGFVSHGIVQ